MTNNYDFPVPLFAARAGQSFPMWKARMASIFDVNGVWDVVRGVERRPDISFAGLPSAAAAGGASGGVAADRKKFDEKKKVALCLLLAGVTDTPMSNLVHAMGDACEVWKLLEERYDSPAAGPVPVNKNNQRAGGYGSAAGAVPPSKKTYTCTRARSRAGGVTKKNEAGTQEKTSQLAGMKMPGSANKSQVILDSGAAQHVCSDKRLFRSMSQGKQIRITVADGNQVTSRGVGTLGLKTKSGAMVFLQNALYCPEFAMNIVSVSQMNREECETLFKKDGAEVKRPSGEVIMTASLGTSGIYPLDVDYLRAEI